MLQKSLVIGLLLIASSGWAYDWEYLGMDGVPATTIMVDTRVDRVFVGTHEGFRFFDLVPGTWTVREEPEQADRMVTVFGKRHYSSDDLIIGRQNADGQGYLEISDDLGLNYTAVHQSSGGPFIDLDGYHLDFFTCSRSDVSPGELLKTTDGGASWSPVTDHGQTDPTCVDRGSGEILVAGDNGISWLSHDGLTWTHVGNNLPAGETIRSLKVFHPGGCMPASWALACTRDSVYLTTSDTPEEFFFQPVFSPGFRSMTTFYYYIEDPLFSLVALAGVTFDGRVFISWNRGGSWEEETGNLPGKPIAVGFSSYQKSLVVLTENHGVYLRSHVVTAVGDDNPHRPQVMFSAWPNPFNPRVNLSFELASAGPVELEIFDVKGRSVATIHEGWMDSGPHQLAWNAQGMASGVYMARIATRETVEVTRLVLVR